MEKQVRQYGTWPSSISPKSLAGGLRLSDVQWDTASDTLVWLEGRGAQGVLVAQVDWDAPRDLTEGDLSVRAHVGYGGGDFTVAAGQVYFAGPKGCVYKQSLTGGAARPITPAFGDAASPAVSADGRWLVYVHTYEHADGLALVDTDGKLWPRKLAYGTDFVMQPTWHPEGKYLAYIAWNHPQMPWDGTELRLLTLEADAEGVPYVTDIKTIVGDEETAIFQPEFSPDGRYLAYISDAKGWSHLYVYDLVEKTHTALTNGKTEIGIPAWVQGIRTFGWSHNCHCIYYLQNDKGFHSLWRYDVQIGKATRIDTLNHYTSMGQLAVSPRREAVALTASASRIPGRIISYDFDSETATGERIHRRSATENTPPEQLAEAEAITWTGHDGEAVYGLYYPPTSDRFEGTGAPPLLVNVHGGPTSQVSAGYQPETQFFTSRGFAVLQVNYRGSTGYGRTYMNKLRGNWGIYDVEDSATGAKYLVEQGLADDTKLVIGGGSAGGFTVLQSFVDKPGFYKAGICRYGVSNQFLLATDTHKFEERYSDSLLGPLPEAADLYRARSPIFHADKIVDPVIVFQGEDDKVVVQSQSDIIVESLKERGVTHEYHVYAGEGHGFRKPETLDHYYNAILKFLTQHVLYA